MPADTADGALLWVKLALLTFSAVVMPLCTPRQYVPLDPEEKMTPHPTQTASILSNILYAWLDGTIIEAQRVSHLDFDHLPPLADRDHSKILVKRSFSHLDPFQTRSQRHIFWGLMRVFRMEYTVICLMLIIRTIAFLASPVGVNRLLNYLEHGGAGMTVRSWVWIGFLFLGPVLGSLAFQWYRRTTVRLLASRACIPLPVLTRPAQTHVLVQTKAIITQLVLDHALRIRVKSDAVSASPPETPDSASAVEETSGAGAADGAGAGTQADAGHNLAGKINNLVTTDLENIINGRDFPYLFVEIPLQLVLSTCFLYSLLGWSALAGMAVMGATMTLPGYIATFLQRTQIEKMKRTDARVQTVTENLGVIRMIKLFGWEPRVAEQLAEKRTEELEYQKKFRLLELLNRYITHLIPIMSMVVTYALFTAVMKEQLTASIIFSSITLFESLRSEIFQVFGLVPSIIQAKVSLDRVNEFLYNTELLDAYADELNGTEPKPPSASSDIIGFKDASFTWANNNDETLTPRRRNFTLRIEGELFFKQGCINLVVGPTGSGKTSLLMALLGEMHYLPAGPDSFYYLSRENGVAYAAQESWVQNERIKDNILLGAPYDAQRYNKVIDQCGLRRDLELLDAGDQTEVGEKGLALSGGQKARITLARAVYSSAEILLFDDVLAALDVHTAKWVVDQCFKGDLIRGRTVILVTHNVALASTIADFVVSMGTDGRIHSQGSLSKALGEDHELAEEFAEQKKAEEKAEADVEIDQPADESDPKKAIGKLIVAEEISEGHIEWPSFKMFLKGICGSHPIIFGFVYVVSYFVCVITTVMQVWFLGVWARQYENHHSSEVEIWYYLTGYTLFQVLAIMLFTISYTMHLFGTLRAARQIHDALMASIMSTTLRWLDKTPASRIHISADGVAVDGPIAEYSRWFFENTVLIIIKLGAVVVMSPIFLVPGAAVAVLGALCGQFYMKAQLSVKREMSNAHAPVLGHFGAAVAGLRSIRAFGVQDAFRKESYKRIDRYTRAGMSLYDLNRWISVRVDAFGAVFTASLAIYLVYGRTYDASSIGFSLNMAVTFGELIIWWIRVLTEFEISGNSLERIHQYLVIEHEPKATESGVPPAYWPASGSLTVEKLSARYSEDGPRVLHEISFKIESGERVGIVGRTGSGKSSLTLALLRCILTEGNVYYDGIPTSSLNLDALRSNITIIPQIPELLSGTLRQNLDPFSQYDDSVLNDALRAAGLFSVQRESDEGRITLDSQIASGGSNLRVIDDILTNPGDLTWTPRLATSAIDYQTDAVIQTSLRRELSKDVTVLTIAHRLQTIMDADKIIVLDAGRIVEFGKPSDLLMNKHGLLAALVEESADKEHLHALANGAESSQTT
ncbi:hypothetical protein WOLCODRAFT_155747 [Wolfiporia cocos MD-104 SS10]|uniref:P-loop containing nucleoside triphosphate hydrolase protein n=1 Tax=Wolfiporia cocos (strain MD-104) TaxID=742152 RepID=A0A2H3JGD9_WOLCO|nr:hypothetical protein WOLCODRAFT_155747 [Wolfiporia cocos MD-104 SS10]